MNDQNRPMSQEDLMQLADEFNATRKPQNQIDPRLTEARERRNNLNLYGNILGSFQNMIQGTTGAQADMRVADSLRAQGNQAVSDVNADIAAERMAEKDKMAADRQAKTMEKLSLDIDKANLDFQDAKATRDPSSQQSKFVQDAYIEYMKETGQGANEESVRQASAHEIYQVSPWMQKMYVNKLRAQKDERDMALRERSVAAREERNKIMREKEEGIGGRFDRAQTFREEEKQEISDKQTEQLAGYDEALDLLEDAAGFKKDVDTGFVTNMSDKMRSFFGKGDVEVAELKMAIGETLAQKVKALSGTAVSDQERAFIADVSLPSINDDDEVFNAKLKRAVATLKKAKENRIKSFEKQGKDPSAFREGGSSSKQKAAPYGDEVERNGKKYKWNSAAGKYQLMG